MSNLEKLEFASAINQESIFKISTIEVDSNNINKLVLNLNTLREVAIFALVEVMKLKYSN